MNLSRIHIGANVLGKKNSFFVKSIFSAGIISGLKLLNGILIIKAIAIISGLSGMPEGGNYINITQIFQIIATAGISIGTIKYLSQHKIGTESFQNHLSGAFFLTLIFSGASALILILFSPFFSEYLFKTKAYFFYFVLLGISSIFFGFNNFLISYFNGTQNLRSYISINTVNAFVGLVFILLTIVLKNKHLLFISIAFYQSAGFLLYGFKKLYRIYKEQIAGRAIQFWDPLKKFGLYAFYTIQNIIVIGVSQIYVRKLIIEKEGLSEAGIWDGMIRISSSYLNVFILILSIFFIPQLSSAKMREAINIAIKKGLLITGILLGCLVFLFTFRDFFLTLILSKQFLPIKDIMVPFLIGDIFRFSGYILAILFLSKGMIQITIVSDILFNGVFFCAFNHIFISNNGLEGSSYAYLLNYLLYFVFLIMLVVLRKNTLLRNG
jgi:O-antigen/teichoic acid export membrane protein